MEGMLKIILLALACPLVLPVINDVEESNKNDENE